MSELGAATEHFNNASPVKKWPACLLLNSGVDIYTVSKLLGHRELRTTQIYAKVVDSTKRKAVDMLPMLGIV